MPVRETTSSAYIVKREWQDCPIDPSWITSGDPAATMWPIANDGAVCAGYWRCATGAFTWRYAVDERLDEIEVGWRKELDAIRVRPSV
jgi:uncharacterized cupin superfamily protein